ncbi:DNA ligase D [Sphingobacterium suaedae]|uniref:DNA ligase (ATP) n=1 Tax=Sphingobacterium suaedae TaxID=1686402 RepID=A0ABW5KCS1_9SPHI
MKQSPKRSYKRKGSDRNNDSPTDKKLKGNPVEQIEARVKQRASPVHPHTSDWMKSVKNAPKQAFYDRVEPMLATLVDQPFDHADWIYEVKWDGYRALAFVNKTDVQLKSRNDKSFNEKFYPVYEELKRLKLEAVLDGEVVVLDPNGQANFASLQKWRSEADGELVYYVFDLLWYKGKDLKDLSLALRKEILNQILPDSNIIIYSEHFETSGIEFLKTARTLGLEGIMAKRKDSNYQIHNRTKDWLKIKASRRQEVVIGGYTLNEDSKKPFSSLLVGVFDEQNKLIYSGKIGTGFTMAMQKDLKTLFKPLITAKSPFFKEPDVNQPSRFRPDPPRAAVTWLKPELVCEVNYAELTKDGIMRHPSFEGMRSDKKATAVVLEKEKRVAEVVEQTDGHVLKPRPKPIRKTLLNPTEKTQVKRVNKQELKFTNLTKMFWPEQGITKGDLINFYYQMAPYILPYLKDRPQSMNRFPDGIHGESFYYKDVTGRAPKWVDTFRYISDTDDRERHYLVGKDEATLLYMANLGCIEMNPWNSTVKKPDYPSFCIIDLDPDKNSFDQVIEAAQVTKHVLDEMGVPCYCKTSGSTGLHIYIPLGQKYTYEQSKEFARLIVTLVHQQIPAFTSLERTIKDRRGKMYLDFLQNRPHATIASVYSVRPKQGATVSMPLHWDEVKIGLKMQDFHIFNAVERVRSEGDLFKPVLGTGIDLKKIVEKYASTL